MDEATGNMDITTDFKVQMMLRQQAEDKNIIMISSRIPSLITVDQLLVLKGGKLVEKGLPYKLIEG